MTHATGRGNKQSEVSQEAAYHGHPRPKTSATDHEIFILGEVSL